MFEVTGDILATDPCYGKDSMNITIENCLPGKWVSEVETDTSSGRIAEIRVFHESYSGSSDDWHIHSGIVGVDSGQAGFFDKNKYPDENNGEYDDTETFYGRVCQLTLGEKQYGEIEFGAVSSSGWGDGGYNLFTISNSFGKVVGAKIVFICEDLEDEDYEEEFDDAF